MRAVVGASLRRSLMNSFGRSRCRRCSWSHDRPSLFSVSISLSLSQKRRGVDHTTPKCMAGAKTEELNELFIFTRIPTANRTFYFYSVLIIYSR